LADTQITLVFRAFRAVFPKNLPLKTLGIRSSEAFGLRLLARGLQYRSREKTTGVAANHPGGASLQSQSVSGMDVVRMRRINDMSTTLIPFGTRFGLLDDFRKEMDSLFNRFFAGDGTSEMAQTAVWTPRLNLSETDAAYHVSVDLPGLKPEDVNVELRHGDLWITGERRGETEEKGQTWHRVERYYGQFRRVVRLGDDVNPENVDAEYKDGVLHITVPKAPEAQPKKIEIKC
jgi:HSP20 family protein